MNIWLEGYLSRLLWAIPEARVNLNQLASCFRGMGWKENLWKRKPDTEPCTTSWCLQRMGGRGVHVPVSSLAMRMILCDSVQPGATLRSAAPQLAANSKWGGCSFAHCGEVDAKFSFSDLGKF